ncbi:MAG: endonuclease domain-containing protein [Maricaulaceae bacterium]|nr:endonuclease domain-containing protein [Maricaulaceae bacterium]
MARTRLTPVARALRRNMTHQEVKLWMRLQGLNRGGWKFRRQTAIGPYIADFASFDPKIVIELDGGQHGRALQRAKDARRDTYLEARGYAVLRFWNIDVDRNMDGVMDRIMHVLGANPRRGA